MRAIMPVFVILCFTLVVQGLSDLCGGIKKAWEHFKERMWNVSYETKKTTTFHNNIYRV